MDGVMSVLFTSYLHLGHGFVAKLRGFATVEDHDQAIIVTTTTT
jgi:calcineurin-like phosphoesterase family protein